jgi:hypothetical protein
MTGLTIASGSVFSTGHIALTGIISGVFAAAIALLWLRGERRALDTVAIGLLTAEAVFMLRKSANMPQLNDDGLQGFSANDWLAPTVTFVVLAIYGAVRQPEDRRRFEQVCAAAVVAAFVITVVTI